MCYIFPCIVSLPQKLISNCMLCVSLHCNRLCPNNCTVSICCVCPYIVTDYFPNNCEVTICFVCPYIVRDCFPNNCEVTICCVCPYNVTDWFHNICVVNECCVCPYILTDCFPNNTDSCKCVPSGHYPACHPLCQDGVYVSCLNNTHHIR